MDFGQFWKFHEFRGVAKGIPEFRISTVNREKFSFLENFLNNCRDHGYHIYTSFLFDLRTLDSL
jgi:hypothetical protein